jgi:hypothetical protein
MGVLARLGLRALLSSNRRKTCARVRPSPHWVTQGDEHTLLQIDHAALDIGNVLSIEGTVSRIAQSLTRWQLGRPHVPALPSCDAVDHGSGVSVPSHQHQQTAGS